MPSIRVGVSLQGRSRPRVLWIDLGGVVIRDPRPIVVRRLCAGRRTDRRRVRTEYYRLSRELDTDAIDLRTMYERLRHVCDVSLSYPAFRELVGDRSLAAIPTVLAALRKLRASEGVRIVITSNVSRPVWRGLERRYRMHEAAHETALSFRLGALKPDPRFFREALRRTGIRRDRVLFLDDSLPNILAARRLGVHAHRIRGARDTLRWLLQLQALASDGHPPIRGRRRRGATPGRERPGPTAHGRNPLRGATPSVRPGRSPP